MMGSDVMQILGHGIARDRRYIITFKGKEQNHSSHSQNTEILVHRITIILGRVATMEKLMVNIVMLVTSSAV